MYSWLLFAHIASVAGFLLAHGTSAAMAFRLRSEKTTDGIRSLAELSKQTTGLVITGLLLGIRGGRFDAVRGAVGLPAWDRRGKVTTAGPGSPEQIRLAVRAAPVGVITAIGVVALVLFLWLMILKPTWAVTTARIRVRRGSPVQARRERFDSQLDPAVE